MLVTDSGIVTEVKPEQPWKALELIVVTEEGMVIVVKPVQPLKAEAGIEVTSLPGACAAVTALTIAGLPTRRFCFEAFLPFEKKERQAVLEQLKTETRTTILYEAPHRLLRTLADLYEALGDRRISLCKELTKRHENMVQTTLREAPALFSQQEPRGEYVIVMEGRSERELKEEAQRSWEEMDIREHMELYLQRGMDKKDAMKAVAKDRGLGKREVYAMLLRCEEEGNMLE